jgi:hypothetical protein
MEKIQTWDQLSRAENFRYYDASPEANRWVFPPVAVTRALHQAAVRQHRAHVPAVRGDPVEAPAMSSSRRRRRGLFTTRSRMAAASVTKSLETGSAVVAYLVRGDTFGETRCWPTRSATPP